VARILVTGVSGFVGKHLTRELIKRGHEVIGVGLHDEPDPAIAGSLAAYLACDLTDPAEVQKIPLNGIDGVVSLAGLAQVGASFKNSEEYKKINVAVLSVLGERIVEEKLPIKVLAVSSGAIYDSDQALPLTEESRLTGSGSPYAQSKILMEKRAEELRASGLDCLVVRPFNHIGPGQEKGFLVPDLFEKISRSLQNGEPVLVGDLKTRRDYTDVRDVVRAYAELITGSAARHDVYNVASGHSVAGQRILDLLLEAMGARGRVEIEVNQTIIRPDDPKELFGSYDRLHEDIGWQPEIDLQRTIGDFVESAA